MKDHIIKKNKTQYLDEYVVDFLDNRRRESPIILSRWTKTKKYNGCPTRIKLKVSEKKKSHGEAVVNKKENLKLLHGYAM